jgi:sucrose-6-phosphate hydrolase SacC (GH32 family)
MPFNQQMNFPTELKLNRYEDGLRINRMPINEIERLYEDSWSIRNKVVKPGNDIRSDISGDLLDIKVEIDVRDASEVGIRTRNEAICFNAKDNTITCLGKSAKISPVNNRIKLRILVDRTSIEVYANDGRVVMTSCFLPEAGGEEVSIYSKGGSSKIISMNIHRLKSIWQNIKKEQ